MRRVGELALAGVLSGLLITTASCSGGGKASSAPSPPPPSPATASPAGSNAYLDSVHDQATGAPGLANAPDGQVLALGTSACHDLTGSESLAQVRRSLMDTSLHPGAVDVDAVLQSAVANLCPAEAGKIPPAPAPDESLGAS